MTNKITRFIIAHKIISAIIAAVIIFAGYQIIKSRSSGSATNYVTAPAQKASIIMSTSGSGQVAATNQIDLKAKASGDVTYVGVKDGQTVYAGQLIASLDARTAEIDLENAKLALAKLQKPADPADILAAQNSLDNAEQSLNKAYDDGNAAVTNGFLDLPSVLSGLDDLLNNYQTGAGYLNSDHVRNVGDTATTYQNKAAISYSLAKDDYDRNLKFYRDTGQTTATSSLAKLLTDTYRTIKDTAQALTDASNAVNFIKDQDTSSQSQGTAAQTNLATWIGKISADLSSILAAKNNLESGQLDIIQKQAALDKLKRGADALDIQTQELTVKQREQAYENYFIRAPFSGGLTKFTLKAFDSVSAGSVVGTLLTDQKEASISLNEVDAANVKIGQKATLTFDAIPDLTLTGQVTQLDQIGTVTQGVVTYNGKVTFDTSDERVKPGMSVTANIITAAKPDVLTVPNSAVKSQANSHYVQILVGGVPTQQPVEVGLANDTLTEITSGLKEGDQVVTRTITATTAVTAPAPSIFGAVGGGNRPRIPGR